MDKTTNGDIAAYTSFRHLSNLFTVYRDGTAQSLSPTAHYKRRTDGKWTDIHGMHIAPALNAALKDAWTRLMGEANSE